MMLRAIFAEENQKVKQIRIPHGFDQIQRAVVDRYAVKILLTGYKLSLDFQKAKKRTKIQIVFVDRELRQIFDGVDISEITF